MGIVSTPNDTSTIAGRATLVFALVVATICGCDALLSTYRAKTEVPQKKMATKRIVLPYPYEKTAPIGVPTSADEGLLANGDCEFVVPDVPKYVERLALGKSHTTGQFLGAQALMQAGSLQNLTKTFLPYIHHHAMIKHLFASKIGLYHASIWMITGVTDPSWELVASQLCPRPEYEFVQMCLHGFGHSGFVRLQHNAYADGYTGCSYQQTVNWGHLTEAYVPCSAAPSTFLEYLCAHGFYHGVWEHMDTSLTPHTYPCVDLPGMPSYRFKTVCFTYMFMITAQADSGAGKGSEVMKSRQKVVLADGKKANGYLCGDLTGQDELHCLFGLAGQYNFNGYSTLYEEKAIAEFGLKPSTGWYHHYPFEDGYMHVDPITMGNDFKSLCFKLVPKGPIDDWDRCATLFARGAGVVPTRPMHKPPTCAHALTPGDASPPT